MGSTGWLREQLIVPATLGIRHFSPASGIALTKLLQNVRPDCILLEAPCDASLELRALGGIGTRPPVGLVGFRSPTASSRLLYPLAPDSAEWVAVRWAHEHGCALEGIDLPGASQLELARVGAQIGVDAEPADPYAAFAAAAGVCDFDVWWERHFEHASNPEAYGEAIWPLAMGLREQPWPEPLRVEWTLREAFMRRRIREVLGQGISPERCVVVCGAIHAPSLTRERPELPASTLDVPTIAGAPSGARLGSPRSGSGAASSLTWFPVVLTAARMGSTSRHGVHQPPSAYLTLLAEAQREGSSGSVAPRFLGRVAELLRASGASTSPSEVIDAVRLAEQLAALSGSSVVTLHDLRDAAETCFSAGGVPPGAVGAAVDAAAQGAAVGALEGVRPLLAHELEQRMSALALPKLEVGCHHTLELDLRPAPGSQASERSTLLHRLRALSLPGIRFLGRPASGALAGWTERWELRGRPELHEALFEAGLLGDSLEDALLARSSTRLEQTDAVDDLVAVLIDVRACALPHLLSRATTRLRQLDLDEAAFPELVAAIRTLRLAGWTSGAIGSERDAPETDVLELLVAAAIRRLPLLEEVSGPNAEEAVALRTLVAEVHSAGMGLDALRMQLKALATGLHGRPRLRGCALALALEQAIVPLPELTHVLSSRLVSVRIREAATFFEGLLAHGHRALSASQLPEALDAWVRNADSVTFSRGLLPLRRAFASWGASERARIAERVGPGFSAPVSEQENETRGDVSLHPPDGPLARALERLDDLEL